MYAILGRRSVAERMGVADRIVPLLSERSGLLRRYRSLAPLYPLLVRSARLPAADVIVASSYAYAHGFRTVNGAPVVCYCHGPFRHLWSQPDVYARQVAHGRAGRIAFSGYVACARAADRAAARSVHTYLTQSPFTAEVIARAYGRFAHLVPPPIDCDRFQPSDRPHEGFFLFAGRLVEAYKRPSLVVDAFARMPELRLRIAGDGPALTELRRRATPNIEFLGRLDDDDLAAQMQACTAAIFPSVDDFGLIPLEVNACGRPVLALAAGGARHTVAPGLSGEFIAEQSVDALVGAVRAFDPSRYDSGAVRAYALAWDGRTFRRQLRAAVRAALENTALTPVGWPGTPVEPADGPTAHPAWPGALTEPVDGATTRPAWPEGLAEAAEGDSARPVLTGETTGAATAV